MHNLLDLVRLLAYLAQLNFHPAITLLANRFGQTFLSWYLFPHRRPEENWIQGICFHYQEKCTRIYVGIRPNDEFFIASDN